MNAQFNITEFVFKQEENMMKIINSATYQNINTWSNKIMNTSQYGEPFLRFTLTAIISIGAILKLSYQTYGMAGLPIFLIKGTKSLESENNEISGSIQQVRNELRKIQEKYHKNQKSHISAKDKALLKKLRKEEKILSQK